jgi:hypothetical protein
MAARALREAITATRGLIGPEAAIKDKTPVGLLTDNEIGRIVGNVLFAWVATRTEQASNEGWGHVETALRAVPCDRNGLDPWDAGAIASVLPKLADLPIDWSKPLGALSRDEMVLLLSHACRLTQLAKNARDAA